MSENTYSNGKVSEGTYPNGTSPNGQTSENGASSGAKNGAANGNMMPTGIYGAVDTLRGETVPRTEPDSQGKVAPKDYQPFAFETEVPHSIHAMPRRRSLRMQWRYLRVLIFSAWLFVRLLFWQIYVRRYFPRWVDRTNQKRWVGYAREFRGFAISLGGVFIKLGQFISTRVDALPEAIVRELESLQDEVPTIKFKRIKGVMEEEIGAIEAHYAWFNETPIAAASLGQAHRAQLRNPDGTPGDRVVVKVQRPGIRQICYTDLAALKIVAWVANKFGFIRRRADAPALTEEFGRVLLEELSYRHEAANAQRFMQMFKNDMRVYIPEVYPGVSTDRVLTLEDVTSIKVTDYAALEAAGISRKEVAERLMDTYLKQIFEHFFFHADPHPGNLFIYPLPVDDPQPYIDQGGGRPFYLIFIDFGMTGALTREIADGMVNTLGAVLMRDPKKLIQSYADLGFILPGANLERIQEAAKAAFDEVWGMSMTEIRDMDYERAANLAGEFNDLIKEMPFYLPQDFIYLGRTISILSGMCTTLDNDFNPWSELEPYAQRLAAQGFGIDVDLATGQLSGQSVFQSLFNGNGGAALVNIAQEVVRRTAPFNPNQQILQKLLDGEVHVVAEPSYAYKAMLRRLEVQHKKTTRAVIFGSFLIAGTLLYTGGETTLALAAFAFCAVSAVYGFVRG